MTAREQLNAHLEQCQACDADPIGCCSAGLELLRAAERETTRKHQVRGEKILSKPSARWK